SGRKRAVDEPAALARVHSSGVPRWYRLLLALVTTAAAGQGWQPGFHCPGLNNYVTTAVALPNGDLIAGGSFTNAGGHPTADYIARWDGRTWQAL
nr:hypothetical protein [Tanacetum cinerariifolium]